MSDLYSRSLLEPSLLASLLIFACIFIGGFLFSLAIQRIISEKKGEPFNRFDSVLNAFLFGAALVFGLFFPFLCILIAPLALTGL